MIVAPDDVVSPVRSAVDLVRWQGFEDMTEDLFDRLARDALPQAREAAATQGFFSAEVELTVDRATTPATATLTITPGPRTRITEVTIDVTGPARDQPPGPAVLANIRDEWLLPVDSIFRQQTWTAAKRRAVGTLAASPFAAATLAASEARIDPAAQSAALSLTLDSGPAFHFGAIDVRGLERYSAELVRNFSSFRAGDLYGEQVLDDFVRRLAGLGLLRERAGVDRHRSGQRRRGDAHAVGDRSPVAAARVRRRLLDRHRVSRSADRTAT